MRSLMESMEWQKRVSDALGDAFFFLIWSKIKKKLGDARQKLIHIGAPSYHPLFGTMLFRWWWWWWWKFNIFWIADNDFDDIGSFWGKVIVHNIRKRVRIIFPKWISIQCILNHIRSNQTKCDQILDRMCNICQGLNFNLWNSLLIPAQLYICCIYCITY